MSKNTRKANAGFSGFGRVKRIILSDTLIEKFTPEEIEVIFAHELGHYRGGHILKNMVLGSVIIYTSFYLCSLAYSATMRQIGFYYIADIAAFPILFFYISVFGLIMLPVTNAVSRSFEREADHYALVATTSVDAFISSMEKLGAINLSEKDPHPLVEFIFYGHPSLGKRIAAAQKCGVPAK